MTQFHRFTRSLDLLRRNWNREQMGRKKILFGYATDTRVFVQHPYKDNDGTWYIPVLKKGARCIGLLFFKPNPLNPDKIENYFDRLTGLSGSDRSCRTTF